MTLGCPVSLRTIAIGDGAAAAALYIQTKVRQNRYTFKKWHESSLLVFRLLDQLKAESGAGTFRNSLLLNLALLHAGQTAMASHASPESVASSQPLSKSVLEFATSNELLAEGAKYMRYATAAYGYALMVSFGLVSPLQTIETATSTAGMDKLDRIAACLHCNIETGDLVSSNLEAGETDCPTYFIAVDHAGKSVVLAVRGTASLTEALVYDLACVSEPLCGGRAHAGIAKVAKRLLVEVADVLATLAKDYPDYTLVVTGHSLGAGIAALVTLILHDVDDPLARRTGWNRVRCFAFAPPPVFAPLAAAPRGAIDATIAFVHDKDCVPHLSLHAARRVLATMSAIDDLKLRWRARDRIAMQEQLPPPEMLTAITQGGTCVAESAESPQLAIPAAAVVWIVPAEAQGSYDLHSCHPEAVAALGIRLDPFMLIHHMFSQYEEALQRVAAADQRSGKSGSKAVAE